MESVVRFLEGKLKLKVNRDKSAVDSATKRKFLGFSFYFAKSGARIRVHPKSFDRLTSKIKAITGRSNAMSMEMRIVKLNQSIRGWVNYFRIADMKTPLKERDENMRRRLRMCSWKQWKKSQARKRNLIRLGMEEKKAWEFANTRKGYWRIANSPILSRTLSNDYFKSLGLHTLTMVYETVR